LHVSGIGFGETEKSKPKWVTKKRLQKAKIISKEHEWQRAGSADEGMASRLLVYDKIKTQSQCGYPQQHRKESLKAQRHWVKQKEMERRKKSKGTSQTRPTAACTMLCDKNVK
jgi:hypothetical protein